MCFPNYISKIASNQIRSEKDKDSRMQFHKLHNLAKYLIKSKIEKIDNNFEIVSTENFKLDDVISQAKKKFGPLNFFDKSIDNGKINIDIAFNFSLISIYYLNEKLKYRVSIFWDV